jgi:hypothetical protein
LQGRLWPSRLFPPEAIHYSPFSSVPLPDHHVIAVQTHSRFWTLHRPALLSRRKKIPSADLVGEVRGIAVLAKRTPQPGAHQRSQFT